MKKEKALRRLGQIDVQIANLQAQYQQLQAEQEELEAIVNPPKNEKTKS